MGLIPSKGRFVWTLYRGHFMGHYMGLKPSRGHFVRTLPVAYTKWDTNLGDTI